MTSLIFILLLLAGCESPTQPCENSISFMLEDLNSTSSTYGSQVGPDSWENEIRLFYFSTSET